MIRSRTLLHSVDNLVASSWPLQHTPHVLTSTAGDAWCAKQTICTKTAVSCVPAGGGVGDAVARVEGGGGFRFVVLCGKFGQSAQRDRDVMRRFGWKRAKQLPRCDHRRLCLWVCGANGWVASTRCAICASRKAGGVGRNGCADCRVDCRDAGSRRNWADSAPWGRRGPIDEYHRPGRRLQRMRNLAILCAELERAFRSIVDDAP